LRRLILAVLLAFAGTTQAVTPARTPNGVATFAGGCFWCMEGPFEKIPGVLSVTSGYSGGRKTDPTYEEVGSGTTGHAEAVQVVFDRRRVTYEQLLEVFWRNIDPLSANGQFCDRGSQYRSAIYYHDAEQRAAAEASKVKVQQRFVEKVVTEVAAASAFYPAEEYHQDYYKKNPVRYQTYRTGCGRDRRLRELWGEAAAH
jgi:peptide-methionine (S)-S-oxide reductase